VFKTLVDQKNDQRVEILKKIKNKVGNKGSQKVVFLTVREFMSQRVSGFIFKFRKHTHMVKKLIKDKIEYLKIHLEKKEIFLFCKVIE